MNQSIVFNDDLCFDQAQQRWVFTGLVCGDKVTIVIEAKQQDHTQLISDSVKFDWEEAVEEWLEDNEPDHNNEIHLVQE